MPKLTHRQISRNRPGFRKTLLASVMAAALLPSGAWALDLANSPPKAIVAPAVAPNVIISLDNSGSMNDPVDPKNPNDKRKRVDLLKDAIKKTFGDPNVIPDGKIRLAWQVMNYTGYQPHYQSLDRLRWLGSGVAKVHNAMRVLDANQRKRFMDYIDKDFTISGDYLGTPMHNMMKEADFYLRWSSLDAYSPWASSVGTKKAGPPYLGCRRNFHILFTDGAWNDTAEWASTSSTGFFSYFGGNYDGTPHSFPDLASYAKLVGSAYIAPTVSGGKSNASLSSVQYSITDPQTRIYRDPWATYASISDFALYSWAVPLKSGLVGELQLPADYANAPATETFTSKGGKSVTLEKYWNPRYDPATWPHLVTYTIGLSKDSIPEKNYDANPNPDGAAVARDPLGDSVSSIEPPSSLLPYGFDGDFVNYADGTYTWRAADLRQPAGHNNYDSGDKRLDMWHAAINGRGRFYAIEKGDQLVDAFRSILQDIRTRSEGGSGSRAASSGNATRQDVGIFVSNYDPNQSWKGWISADKFDTNGKTTPAWGGKTSADLLDAMDPDQRVILTWSNEIVPTQYGQKERGGVPFRWNKLNSAQQVFLNRKVDGSQDNLGDKRVAYIRGDRSQEGALGFRARQSVQGSIINSELWYVGAPDSGYEQLKHERFKTYHIFKWENRFRLPMLYVGGDDGMLHGFSALDGTEKIAYVPRGVLRQLNRLTDSTFNEQHRYFVDGSPMTGDVDAGFYDKNCTGGYCQDWKTILVGTLGAGGKGYFVLDVTRPGSVPGSSGFGNEFTENSAFARALVDTTETDDQQSVPAAFCRGVEACLAAGDIGYIFDKPVTADAHSQRSTQITLLNNNRWAVVMGNGYNSKNGRPVLLIQYLTGNNKNLLRLVATGNTPAGQPNTTDNGLSAPRLVDINDDGRPDVVYAGDLKGNLWKFLISDSDDSKWGPAQWDSAAATTTNHTTVGVPLFSATNDAGVAQPISTAPAVRVNTRLINGGSKQVSGLMVAFGTGRNVTTDDPQNTDVQSIYSVLDNTRYKRVDSVIKGVVKSRDRVEVCAAVKAIDRECNIDVLAQPVTKAQLAKRLIASTPTGTRGSKKFWSMDEANSQKVNWANQKGWYMDLPESGERLLKPLRFYGGGSGSLGDNILYMYTQVPASGNLSASAASSAVTESCDATTLNQGSQYLTLVNIIDGERPSQQIIDTDGDGVYSSVNDGKASRMTVGVGAQTMIQRGNTIINSGPNEDGKDIPEVLATLPTRLLRLGWRQLE